MPIFMIGICAYFAREKSGHQYKMKNKEESFLRIKIRLGGGFVAALLARLSCFAQSHAKSRMSLPFGFLSSPLRVPRALASNIASGLRHPSLSHVRLYAYPIPHGTKPLSRHILAAARLRYSTVGCVPLTLGLVMATATDRQLTSRFTQGD